MNLYINSRKLLKIIALSLFVLSKTGYAGPLDELQPGQWYEAPNSKLSAYAPDPLPPGYHSAVIKAWSGGAYDTKRDRLIVWGGGHGDYAGNEIYTFDINTLSWSRLTEPSTDVGGDESTGLYPDGLPRSRHTYNYIEYMPNIDRFVSVGGGAMYPSAAVGDNKFHEFDFDTKKWSHSRASILKGGTYIGSFAVYDPITGHLFRHSRNSGGGLDEYNPSNNTWKQHARYELGLYVTAAIDPSRHILVALGNDKVPLMWDLDNPDAPPVVLNTTGDKTIESGKAPGFVYDPVSDKFVGWNGGSDMYVLDPTTWVWNKITPSSSNKVTPPSVGPNGTYGRFRYIPSKNIFVIVNSTGENVYFYKLTADDGSLLWPSVYMVASLNTIASGSNVELTWSSNNADTCQASGSWSGSKAINGSEIIGPLIQPSVFKLTCTGSSGTSVSVVNVEIDGDVTPPLINKITAMGNPPVVKVIYNEPVEKNSAETITNYQIEPNINIDTATLEDDGMTVALLASQLNEGVTYQLTVNNIMDTAVSPNIIAANTTKNFSYVGGQANNTLPANYVWDTIESGKTVYVDRSYVFTNIPENYIGLEFLRTANDDKYISGPDSVSFNVDEAVTVFVAYDFRNTPIPTWLATWNNTGDVIEASHTTMNLYRKDFDAGVVSLDGNELGNSMYVALVAAKQSPVDPVGNNSSSDNSVAIGNNSSLNASDGGSGALSLSIIILLLLPLLSRKYQLYRRQ